MIRQKFQKGINLGGWLSQYEFTAEQPLTEDGIRRHFETFITEPDIRQIAGWGFDHIRLPVSGYLLYDREKAEVRKEITDYIDRCIYWCRESGLNLVLDLHDLWGNIYGAMDEPMPLLTDDSLKGIFYRIWEELADHYMNWDTARCRIMFELFNEVSDASGCLWNRMYQEAVRKIRRIDAERPILVGSNGQNSAAYLKHLDLMDDPLVIYNFHYYDPLVFTHQKAHFSEELREFDQTVAYPGDISGFADYLKEHPRYQMKYALTAEETRNDKELMERLLEPACRFIQYSGHELYCGEFGVIDSAPPKEAAKWMNDLLSILDEHGIGHALWNYKCLDFGLLDKNGNVISETLKKAVLKGMEK